MSEEIQKKLFDPFFTTRAPMRSGLGMSVAHGIMKRHGGAIEVESKEGDGSTITLSFPVSKV
jgi:signal transduction histidine kinase